MDAFVYSAGPAEVHFGRNRSTTAIREWIVEHGYRRALLIASAERSAMARELTADVSDSIAVHFAEVVEHVPSGTAEAARRVATDARCDLIISVGGGSATGLAKAVALTHRLPIMAVPTTLAGSEMTDVWGITSDGRKRTGKDPVVRPLVVVYDSDLLASLPDSLAVSSSFNAIAHCVEAFWAPRSNPVTGLLAGEGLRAIATGLRSLHDEPTDARDALMYGSFLAGTVFSAAGSGLHHKICHALGGAFDLSHSGTHAVILPEVLKFNAPAVPEAADAIASALGGDEAAAALRQLLHETHAPLSLRQLGLSAAELTTALDVVADQLPIQNPRTVSRGDIQSLLHAAFDEGN
ncbi:maleylacetate reductase [Ruicaihuangia caeni]|uniref:maleylacetate reductase n=1 Tax=Ruicaihuangia caeni TaxID=3042517 RepID=UPI00338E317A